jgi:hypothetical protein
MWTSAAAADTNMAWQQVSAWQRTYELLTYYATQLRIARNELTAVWPAEPGTAAASFVAYLDGLLLSIGNATEDAVANRQALTHVLSSLSTAKADMATLKTKWDEYEAEDRARAQNLSMVLPHSAGADWRYQLNELARDRMTRNDQEVFEATGQMATPVVYRPDYGGHHPSDGDGATPVAPPGDRAGTAVWVSTPVVTPVSDLGSGADLAGVPAQSSAGHPGGGAGLIPPIGPDGDPHVGSSGSDRVPPLVSIPVGGSRLPTADRGHLTNPVRGSVSATPPGGVIGSRPPGSSPQPHEPPAGAAGGRRVNPVGGVIDGHAGPGGVGGPVPYGGGAAGRRRLSIDPEPTHIWTVEQGVPGVIEPAPERPHLPGPGVIGIDR